MTREDTGAILFSNRFSFTPDGQPVISVRVMDEQKEVEFSAPKGLRIYPSGPGGPSVEVSGGKRWRARVRNGKASKVSKRLVLDSTATRDFQQVKQMVKRWREKGLQTTTLELGSLFSFKGTVFDTRKTIVCLDSTKKQPPAALKELKSPDGKFLPEIYTQEILEERPSGRVTLRQKGGDVKIDALNAIWFEPLEGALTVIDVEYAKGFPWHGRKTRKYGGTFYLAVDRHGKLAIVNVLPAEKLLKGLVPAEIYPDSPDEALKAQAVTARNEIMSKIGHRHLADPYLLCADQDCQVYKGLNAERDRASRAVDATRGQVMFEEDGALGDARYSSTCGGHTEDAHEAWPGVKSKALKGRWDVGGQQEPYAPIDESEVKRFIESPPKSYCGKSSKSKATFRWAKVVPAKKINKRIADKYTIGRLKKIDILHRGVSGRVNKVHLTGTRGEIEVSGELTIRRLFGGLKSSMFLVESTVGGDGTVLSWKFTGGGFGHGVGMCQLGAIVMAKEGKSFLDILQFYYRNVSVKRIY